MPKIVNTEEKVAQICELAYSEFIEVGVDNFSLNSFMSSLKMSKGQFYHYFKTKDDLTFEVIKRKSHSLINHAMGEIEKQTSFRGKVFKFFAHYLDDSDPAYQLCNKIVNDILHMYLNSKNPKIREFNEEIYATMFGIIDGIFNDEIAKKGLPSEYKKYAKIAFAVSDGMYVRSLMLDSFDFKKELSDYLNDIIKIFEDGVK